MTYSDELLHVFGKTGRPSPNRSRHVPLIATPDQRSLDWLPLLIVFGGGSAFFFLLGLAGWLAWVLLP